MQRTWRRRNYFIKKDFQGRFVLRFFFTVILTTVIFTIILSIISLNTMTVVYKDSHLRLDRTPFALIPEILQTYWIYIVLIGIVIGLFSILISHRVAGPIYRIERSIEEITRGNLSFKIRLREKDEMKELAERINEMVGGLSERIGELKGHADNIDRNLEQMLEMKEPMPETLRNSIATAAESAIKLKALLALFQTKDNTTSG